MTGLLVSHGQETLPPFRLRREIVSPTAVTEFRAAATLHVVAPLLFLYRNLAGRTSHDWSPEPALDYLGLFDVQGGPRRVLLAGLVVVPRSTTRSASECTAGETCPLKPVFADIVLMGVIAIGLGAGHDVQHSLNGRQAPLFSQSGMLSARDQPGALRFPYTSKSGGGNTLRIVHSETTSWLQMQRT
jgi:hypothetical protein